MHTSVIVVRLSGEFSWASVSGVVLEIQDWLFVAHSFARAIALDSATFCNTRRSTAISPPSRTSVPIRIINPTPKIRENRTEKAPASRVSVAVDGFLITASTALSTVI